MKMLRRTRPDDSATEYPSPQQLAGDPSANRGHDRIWDDKDGAESSEIDALIGCLATTVGCFFAPFMGGSTKSWCLSARTMTLLILVAVGGTMLYRSLDKEDAVDVPSWNTMSMTTGLTFGAKRQLTVGPDKGPVTAVISTHHRTGTVLFQNMGERLCEVFLMDYERVDEPFKLKDPNATRTLLLQRYWNSTQRLVAGMHGFEEDCHEGQNVGMYCNPLDYECWLGACASIDQDPQEQEIPIAHVVRNPVEILISAYLYHQQDPPPEEWLYNPKPDALEILPMELQEKYAEIPYYKVLQQLPPELGILVEFTVENEAIYRMARNYRDMAEKDYALNLHFENFKKDFRGNIQNTLDHLKITEQFGSEEVMDIAMIFDLSNMPEIERTAYQVESHITEGKHNKDDLRKLLYKNETTRLMLNVLAQEMDYNTAFPSLEDSATSKTLPSVTNSTTKDALHTSRRLLW